MLVSAPWVVGTAKDAGRTSCFPKLQILGSLTYGLPHSLHGGGSLPFPIKDKLADKLSSLIGWQGCYVCLKVSFCLSVCHPQLAHAQCTDTKDCPRSEFRYFGPGAVFSIYNQATTARNEKKAYDCCDGSHGGISGRMFSFQSMTVNQLSQPTLFYVSTTRPGDFLICY